MGRFSPLLASRGFSLLEMLFAVVVLAVGSLSVITMHRVAVTENQAAHSAQTAVALAGQLLETTHALQYKDSRLAATGGYVAPASTLSPANPLNPAGQTAASGFTRTWQISDNSPMTNVKTVSVRVAWNQGPQTQQITISTIKAK